MPSDLIVPRATYRVQLHPGFDFDDAAAITGYLRDLGISHLYCSPYLQARAGSTHGYDVVDPQRPSEDLGGAAGHERLMAELDRHEMGHVLDVVPNHMAVGDPANRWWWDVLKHGPASKHARYFDINWDPAAPKLRWMVHCPVLGDHYGRVLDAGEIRIERRAEEGTEVENVVARYFEHTFPISPASVAELAGGDVDTFIERANSDTSLLHELLERQNYRLAYWKTAAQELNYRRFFAINELVALRIEDPSVFDDIHAFVLQLVRDGKLNGLRIDHIDGLRDPEDYLQRLRAEAPTAYIVVEKILELTEQLPVSWPVQGTTGYDFLNVAGGLMIDPDAEVPLTELYGSFTGVTADLDDLRREKKLLLLETELATDLQRLTDLFVDVCEGYPRHRDYTRHELSSALAEAVAAFPVYRSYVRNERTSDTDERVVLRAIEDASKRRPDLDSDLFVLIGDVLLMRTDHDIDKELALRFQQLTGPAMAKGIEDTAFYVYNRFVALNEVGGDPGHFGISLDDFHAFNRDRVEKWPHAMLATSTHDTKRSEDVRARLALLSEIPGAWGAAVARWSSRNERYRRDGMPDRNMEYLLYQTLVGTWPIVTERIVEYMAKAAKEAKVHTSWIDPDRDYDDALRDFVQSVLSDRDLVSDLDEFVAPLVDPGYVNSLAQTLLKLTAPGVPDIYQGQEVWDFSLVDPDNRRPIDYTARRDLLKKAQALDGPGAWAERVSGTPKVMVTNKTLQVRAERPDAFRGGYQPLPAEGPAKDHIVAFVRGDEVITVVPRLVLKGASRSPGTDLMLPDGSWRDVFTGEIRTGRMAVAPAMERFPVSLMVKESA